MRHCRSGWHQIEGMCAMQTLKECVKRGDFSKEEFAATAVDVTKSPQREVFDK